MSSAVPPEATAWIALVLEAGGASATVRLPAGEALVGRDATCGVRLGDPEVAPVAARLKLGAEGALTALAPNCRLDGRGLAIGEATPLKAGATLAVGNSLITFQPARRQGARRLWTHGSFEMRLEEECLRGEARSQDFCLLRVRVVDPASVGRLEEVLSNELRLTDVLGVYGPGEYEALLPETGAEPAQGVARRVEARALEAGVRIRLGLAAYPTDGLGPDELSAFAGRFTRDESEAVPAEHLAITQSAALQDMVARVAKSSLPVLILGETGSGKERTAELIHTLSQRRKGPFLRLNCAALTESLLESELFGYERGAFTGAVTSKPGLLQTADTGTVFLDEVGELPPIIQAKLLRVIEERQVMRLGGLKPTGIDVRFVSATNRNLEDEMARGTFRADLYFRIAGVQLWVPPLRERLDELPLLASLLLSSAAAREGREVVPTLSAEASELMRRYHWPGNVRELRNVLERAVLLSSGDVISREHLPVEKMMASFAARKVTRSAPQHARTNTRSSGSNPRLQAPVGAGGPLEGRTPVSEAPLTPTPPAGATAPSGAVTPQAPVSLQLKALERERIKEALNACAGNQSAAARMLGMSRRTLVSRLTEYGFARPRSKGA